MDDDWGTLVWLVMTTGIRRGEVCALRWRDVDLDAETIAIRRSYILHKGIGVEKDTKTHQMRRIAIDWRRWPSCASTGTVSGLASRTLARCSPSRRTCSRAL
jgi:integrase